MSGRGEGYKLRKKRANARRRERDDAYIADLRASGASCGNCASFEPSIHVRGKHECSYHTDFYGYVLTTADSICMKWSAKS
jgi:hypothetical protein